MPTRVVIVEDHTLFADAIQTVLTDAGMEVPEIALNGRDALEAVERSSPDIVLMDLGLPDADGLAVGEHILSNHPDTKVLILSALSDARVVRRAVKNGFSGYLTKDTPIRQFVSAIETALGGDVVLRHDVARASVGGRSPEERDAALQYEQLTPREREVLALLVEGSNTQEIAKRFSVSPNTVRTHVQNILMKLQVSSRLEAVTFAVRFGFVEIKASSI